MPQRLMVFLCAVFFTICDSNLEAQSLQTNDTITRMQFKNVLNHAGTALTLPNPSIKLIILDFWSTSCMACVKSFPMMDSLQKQFKDSIQIILVSKQSTDSLLRFFSIRKNIKTPAVTMMTGDTLLNRLFPHDSEPFHVWIDANGIVKFITGGENTTAKNISLFLNSDPIRISKYKTRKYTASLVDTAWLQGIEYYSGISHCIPNNHLSGEGMEESRTVTMNCNSVVELFQEAFTDTTHPFYDGFKRKGRVLLETADPYKYTRPKHGDFYPEWQAKYSYNYQLIVPEAKGIERHKIMIEDLERYFNLEAKIEKRSTNCFTLVTIDPEIKLKKVSLTKSKLPTMSIEDSLFYPHCQSYGKFSQKFTLTFEYYFSRPFEDSTGISGDVQYGIRSNILRSLTPAQLRLALNKMGLDLIEKDCLINVLVIRDKQK
jgi:thiol-disulfide isomerase/thioredoxin